MRVTELQTNALSVRGAGVSVCGAWDRSALKPQMAVGVEYAKRGLKGAQFDWTVAHQPVYTVP